jgi:hypothetical protein
MAKRLSNKQRIERMAEELSKETEDKDKEPKPTVRKTARSRKTAPAQKRMKFIWKVVDPNAREIASFPYREKPEAEARAAELSEKTGKAHTVNPVRVPMEDNE